MPKLRPKALSLLLGLIGVACFAPGPVPAPWTSVDVGGPGMAGSATFDPATFVWTNDGGGGDIWNTADQFHYVSMPINGDCTITARCTAQGNTDVWAKAGVMIRETTAAGSTMAFAAITPGNGAIFQWRTATGGGAAWPGSGYTGGVPIWIRAKRVGTTFTGYYSTNGSTWNGSGTVTITMATSVTAGLAVTAHNNGLISNCTFDNVVVTDGSGNYLWPEAPPTGLSATPGVDQAALSWTAAAGATSYNVLRGTVSGGPYTQIATVTAPTVTYTDTGIQYPNTYYYVVQAVGSIGTSPSSNQASCSPLQPNIIVSPTSLQVAEAGGTATFTVTPRVPPGAQLTIDLSSSNAGAMLLTAPGGTPQGSIQLVWAAGSTAALQVTVTGVDQHLETNQSASVNFTSVTCTDTTHYPPTYVPPPIPVTIVPDSPAIIVNPPSGLSTTNGGPQITFTVQLATIPSGNVVLNLSVSDPSLATVAPTQIQITPGAWNTPVTVTVTPLDANTQTTYIAPYEILIDSSSAQTADPLYQALPTTVVPISTPVSTPPLAKTWGNCGLLGIEAGLLPLGLLAIRRRRRVH